MALRYRRERERERRREIVIRASTREITRDSARVEAPRSRTRSCRRLSAVSAPTRDDRVDDEKSIEKYYFSFLARSPRESQRDDHALVPERRRAPRPRASLFADSRIRSFSVRVANKETVFPLLRVRSIGCDARNERYSRGISRDRARESRPRPTFVGGETRTRTAIDF